MLGKLIAFYACENRADRNLPDHVISRNSRIGLHRLVRLSFDTACHSARRGLFYAHPLTQDAATLPGRMQTPPKAQISPRAQIVIAA